MKLWQKIFLPTLALMVLSTALTSTLLLKTSRDSLWQREGQRAVTQQQYLAGMLRAGVISHRLQLGFVQLNEEETSQTAQKVLSQQAQDSYLTGLILLDADGDALYDTMPDSLVGTLPDAPAEEPSATVYELRPGAQNSEWYLVCVMPVTLESVQYRLGAAYCVSDLQRQLTEQAVGAVALCLVLSLAGAVLLLILVRVLLRPLAALDESARRVASGHYGERLHVSGGDELAGLAQDMNDMAQAVQDRVEQLERTADERKTFIGNLAHEMKTPLTSILGFADLLYLPKNVPEETRVEYARVISEEAKRLRALSGKLLELTTLGSSSILLLPTSLRTVADEVEVSLRPVMAQSDLKLHCSCPDVLIDMDRELFKSLLYNLLDNGRKASQKGSLLELTAQVDAGGVTILVRDHGSGIPQEEIDKICQPFYMVDKSRSRKAGGVGLGLALCQEIVAVHHGSMNIQSQVDQGTSIILRFPVSAAEQNRSKGGVPCAKT
ncbi:MAG: ATP-binding protein [Oscillospiraceae bacterium]